MEADRCPLALEDEDARARDRRGIDRERFTCSLEEFLVIAPVRLGVDCEAAQERPIVGPCRPDLQDGLRDDADRSRRFELMHDDIGNGEALGPEDLGERGGELVGRLSPRGRLVEQVELARRLEELSDRSERVRRLLPEGADIEGEDLVEALVAEVGPLERCCMEDRLARVDVVAILLRGSLDHGPRPVDRRDRPARQALADQRGRNPVPAADLEETIVRLHSQRLD
jgi:hypothetical protein